MVGAVSRKVNVVARFINDVRMSTLTDFVREVVSTKVSLLCTDQWVGYNRFNKEYSHRHVDHSINQYIVGAVHTQPIEGLWSLVKRGMVGPFHKVSKKYLPLYVAEFQFRHNNRKNNNIFAEAIRGC